MVKQYKGGSSGSSIQRKIKDLEKGNNEKEK